jgi:serine protease
MIALATFAFGCAAAQVQEPTPEEVRRLLELKGPAEALFVPGEVIVKMKPGSRLTATDLSRLGIEDGIQVTSGGELIYRIAPSVMATLSPAEARNRTLAVVQALKARPDVEYAQPNYILGIARTPNDPRFSEQWHYRNNGTGPGQSPGGISLPRAWDKSIGSSSIVVAVIDTGILPNHPDIVGSPNLIAGFDMIRDLAIANDGDGRDNNPTDPGDAVAANECSPGSPARSNSWHGTHVAGTIGVGKTDNGIGVAGVSWSVRVQAVRVLGKCGGTNVDINDGIRWAAGLPVPGVPVNPTPARVINMSLGAREPCSMTPATQAAINDAVGSGAAVVVAAGNDAVDASQFFPASCNNVITVAASDYRGYLVTRYSNFGPTVEIMAPGGDVLRDDDGDGNNDGVLSMVQGGYARYNGTSMAAPHVAGVAALWLAQTPALTPAQLLAELQRNALPRTSTQCPQPCGAGLLSALRGEPSKLRVVNLNLGLNLGWLQQGAAFKPYRLIPEMTADLERVRSTAATAGYAGYNALVDNALRKLLSGQPANNALAEINDLIRLFQRQATGINLAALTLGIELGVLQQGARNDNRPISMAIADLGRARTFAANAGYQGYDGYINSALRDLSANQPVREILPEVTDLILLFQGQF